MSNRVNVHSRISVERGAIRQELSSGLAGHEFRGQDDRGRPSSAIWVSSWRTIISLMRSHGSRIVWGARTLQAPQASAPPADLAATLGEHRDWLVDELSRFDAPVDLVRHSSAGGYVLEVAMSRPDLIRNWVSDTVAGYEPDCTWHDLAKLLQTPAAEARHIEGP